MISAHIKVTPLPFTMIMLWRLHMTRRANTRPLPFQDDIDASTDKIKVCILDFPRGFEAEQALNEFSVAHVAVFDGEPYPSSLAT
jgi:hypothetical protein